MDTSRLARSAVALVGVGLFAGALGILLIWLAYAVGLPRQEAYTVGSAAAVTVALAVADTYTPIGSGPSERLAAQPTQKLLVDFLITGVVAAGVAAVLALAGFASIAGGLLVIGIGVAIGYGTFVARNVEQYRQRHRGTRPRAE